jgi:Uma2 family endonuclease
MATQTRSVDLNRAPYSLTVRQVERMIEAGIIPERDDVELVGGTLYKMVKQEPHNFTVGRVADLLRRLLPEGFYIREEKSVRHGKRSLPEPDVVIAPGRSDVFRSRPPETRSLPLIVEVCHHSQKADYRDKLRRYAAAGVPIYWVVDLHRRSVAVFTQPENDGNYAERIDYAESEDVPVILNGVELGRISVADVLPPCLSS